MNSTFQAGGSSPTNVADSSIAHTQWKKRKQIKEKAGTGEREGRQNESEMKKKKKKKRSKVYN